MEKIKKMDLSPEQQKLVEQHIEYAEKIARKFANNHSWCLDDLLSEARAAMVECALRYDKDNNNGASFVTFAHEYIKGKLIRFVQKEKGLYQENYQVKMTSKVSIDQRLGEESDSNTFADVIPSSENLQMEYCSKDLSEKIKSMLTEEEIELMEAKYGTNSGREAIKKIAEKQGVSERYVYTLIEKATVKVLKTA